jgi:hypothetical protein
VVKQVYGGVVWIEYLVHMAKTYFTKMKILKLLSSKLPSNVVTQDQISVYLKQLSEREGV